MLFAFAVTTCPRPGDVTYLPQTLANLAAAGFPKPLIVAEPGSITDDAIFNERRLGACGNYRRALSELMKTDATYLAVFQDDIHVTKGMYPALVDYLPTTNGIVSLYTPHAQHRDTTGWHRLESVSAKTPIGALAVIMPRHLAQKYLDRPENPGIERPTTASLGEFCQVTKTEWWVHSPSFVRHIGEVSAIENRRTMPPIITTARNCAAFCEDMACLS